MSASDQEGGEEERPLGRQLVLIIGGALMAVGSCAPWTHATLNVVTLTRSGLHLGANEGLSPEGFISLVGGGVAIGVGIFDAMRSPARWSVPLAAAVGVVGLLVGLDGLVGAITYTSSVKAGLSGVTAGIGYGIWILIAGSVSVVATVIPARRPPRPDW